MVERLRDIGAEIAPDKRGQIRRVSFLVDNLKRPITDENVTCLAGITELEALWLSGNDQITDKAMVGLKRLANMRALDIANTNLSDAVFAVLKHWPLLTQLALPKGISAAGISQPPVPKALDDLSLELDKGAERGLKHLATLPKLRKLDIEGDLTDAGLEHLKKCHGLKELSAYLTKVTTKGVAKLQKALPEAEIYH